MVFGVIYVITNLLNGMQYVGQTTRSVEQRFKEHLKADSYIGCALRDFGAENFSVEIVAECASKKELNEKEIFFIEKFDCMAPNGYNLTAGGQYCPLWENGSGFMLCYMSNVDELVLNVKQPSILRAFFHIAANQQYGNSGVFGYRCSKKHLQEVLGIQRPTLWAAINWLKDNFLINETQVDGVFEYMVNPEILTIGKSKKFRVAEWNRRCAEYIKKLESKSA